MAKKDALISFELILALAIFVPLVPAAENAPSLDRIYAREFVR